jgi:hypothetical protein
LYLVVVVMGIVSGYFGDGSHIGTFPPQQDPIEIQASVDDVVPVKEM